MTEPSNDIAPDIEAGRRTILGDIIWFCLQNIVLGVFGFVWPKPFMMHVSQR